MIILKDFGSFYLSGRTAEISDGKPTLVRRNRDMEVMIDPRGHYSIEATYVQYFIPEPCRNVWILIHGGGHTGAIWESTPDGRKGWVHYLLEQGIGVYIVDTAERGRAGWCPIKEIWPEEAELRTHEQTWERFRFGAQSGFAKKEAFPGQQFPIESFEQLTKYNVPRWNSHAQSSINAIGELVMKIGKKCSILAHSQGAEIAMRCLNEHADSIENVILLEPAAFPEMSALTSKEATKIFIVLGDFIDQSTLWSTLKRKAIEYNRELTTAGFPCQILSLPKLGIKGNSHMCMMDKNNKEVLLALLGTCTK